MMGTIKRLSEWVRAGLATGTAQAAIQALQFLAGLAVIRLLAPDQYAYYTIANSALGTMTVLADGGITSGMLACGGRVWTDRERLGSVLATGLDLRRRLSLVVLAFSVPVVAALLRHQAAPWIDITAIEVALVLVFYVTVSSQLLELVPRLHQRLAPLLRLQLASNAGRLIAVLLLVPLLPLAALAAFCPVIPQWWANRRLRGVVGADVPLGARPDGEVRVQLLAQVRRAFPGAAYFALSGQLTVWLASLFGRTATVAAVGALGRLAMILAVVGTAFGMVGVPRFARIPAARSGRVLLRYWQSQGLVLAVCLVPLALLVAFPAQTLAILGPHYSGYEREAALMAVCSTVGVLDGCAYSLGSARGIIAPPRLVIPLSIVVQTALVVLLPLDTVAGVIWLGTASAASLWALHATYFVRTARRAALAGG